MKDAQCAPASCGDTPNDLAAGTASHRLNFLAARLNGTENPPKQPVIWRMSAERRANANCSSKHLPRSTVDWETSQADDFRTRGRSWKSK
jgi:hypothetical protein